MPCNYFPLYLDTVYSSKPQRPQRNSLSGRCNPHFHPQQVTTSCGGYHGLLTCRISCHCESGFYSLHCTRLPIVVSVHFVKTGAQIKNSLAVNNLLSHEKFTVDSITLCFIKKNKKKICGKPAFY
ncbi:hypothetical protein CRENBAI_020750 [Crenichthys baileyi]|uniref:Uncharacterized protein n=1 Tax=Crenichthys baileyi TaxID=28760 RepID=A0AAV9R744_9TELE